MVRKIRISSRANEDFIKITEYLNTNWNLKQIRKFNKEFEEKLNIIKYFPQAFPPLIYNINIRKCVLNEQISIYYEITETELLILTLFDSRQDTDKLHI